MGFAAAAEPGSEPPLSAPESSGNESNLAVLLSSTFPGRRRLNGFGGPGRRSSSLGRTDRAGLGPRAPGAGPGRRALRLGDSDHRYPGPWQRWHQCCTDSVPGLAVASFNRKPDH